MESIAKYFESSKKRDLSDGSKTSEEPKKLKETTSTSRMTEECDVFNDGLDNDDCRGILLNCLKNLEKEVKYIRSLGDQNRQTQIKGEQSLADLSKSVKFITDKFDEYEKEREGKNEIIKKLNEKVSALTERSKVLEESIDQQEQYSRRNCLLIHGVEENSNEDTDKLALNIINNDLEIDLTETAIDRTHRIGDPKKKKKKVRPIIVTFVRCYDRKQVFSKKKLLKGKGISITESLTRFRMKKLEEAREKHGFKNFWSVDGRIMFKEANDKPSVYYN